MSARRRRHDDDLGIYGLPGDVAAWDLRFDADDPAHLEPVGAGAFRLRVVAEPGLADGRAVLRSAGGIQSVPLDPTRAGRFETWTGEIGPLDGEAGLSFAFRVAESGRPVYLVPTGTTSSVERLDRWTVDPAAPPLSTPDWAKGAVIYQVFPERFANGDPSNDPAGVVPWGSAPRPRQFQGGDLDGVVDHLDHLEHLGVDAIYLNPVFASPSNHKYDTVDYMTVDPAFGGNEALARLVDAAHRAGIRVVLDASFNHVHPRFFAFADLVRKGRRSAYRDWFVVDGFPLHIGVRRHRASGWYRRLDDWAEVWERETGLPVVDLDDDGPPVQTSYESWYGVPTMPRVALHNPEPREYMLEVARHWLREYDVDGWRMDVARYVDPDFWVDFRRACRSVKPDAYLLAEIMGDTSPWLQGDAFDATMNYTFRFLALGFLAKGDMDGPEFLDHAARLYDRHPLAVTLVNQNLVGSHDTPRFLTEAGGDRWRSELAAVLQLTYPGAPGLYYGDEVGLGGDNDPGCRGAMPWGEIAPDSGHIQTIASLTALRRRTPALRTGEWRPVGASTDAVVFERRSGRAAYLVGINRGAQRASISVAAEQGRTAWGDGALEGGRLVVGGRSGVVVRL